MQSFASLLSTREASLFGIVYFIIVLCVIGIFLFEIVMFIDAIRNPRITNGTKVIWLLGMLLLHPFVAIAYYFTDRKKNI